MKRIFSNARIVSASGEFIGTVVVQDGYIQEVQPGSTRLAAAEDLHGDYLLPGLIELHTDNMERHFRPRPGVNWPPLPAILAHDAEMAAAGVTTVFDAIAVGAVTADSNRLELLDEMVAAVAAAQTRGLLRADHRLHLRCEVSNGNILELWQRHAGNALLGLVSLMDHTPGQRQFVDIAKYRHYYQSKHGFNDAEMAAFIAQRKQEAEKFSASNRQVIAASCRERGIILASHDDATLAHVTEAAQFGTRLAEFPTTVEAAQASRKTGMAVLMGAPNLVRGESHSGNVSARELARLGLVDILSSDYIPMSMLQAAFLLPQIIPEIGLVQAVAWVTHNPARVLGLTDRGDIAPDKRADLVRVREHNHVPAVSAVWRTGERIM
jgi:alpha-D-ribose 1-methylphosphonate 5-triphosphate diphosphatase